MPTYRSDRPTQSPDVALAGALPDLIAAELLLRKNASQHGITYVIAEFGGIRTASDTAQAMAYRDADYAVYLKNGGDASVDVNTWRPIAPYGDSYHNYGAAFDVFVTGVPDGRDQAWGLTMLKNAAMAVGLSSDVANDPPHFELPISLSDAQDAWMTFTGGTGVPKGSSTAAVLAVIALGALVAIAIARRHGGGSA